MSSNNLNMHEQLLEDFEGISLGSLATKQEDFVACGSTLPGRKRFLVHFMHRHLEFRLPEAEAIAELAYGSALCEDGKPPIVWEAPADDQLACPYWYVHLPSDSIAQALVDNAFLMKAVLEPFAEAPTWETLHENISNLPQEFRDKYAGKDQSFKFLIEAYGRSVLQDEKVELINAFETSTKFLGPIDLKTPMHKWWVFLVGTPSKGATMPPLPQNYIFAREFGLCESRTKLVKYDLKKRAYIGPTSMDPELSFIMCNMGGVKKHSLVMDPNVGTGSILVSAAAQGAHTFGFDIDIRVVKFGKVDSNGEHLNLWSNFRQYNLEAPVGLWRGDMHRSALRPDLEDILDAILCDPPYGVRAGGRKSNSNPDIKISNRAQHIASTLPYSLAECVRDLVDMAARLLRVGGRLVYWIPVAEGYYDEDELPTHPAMKFVANSEQILAARYGRRLITMAKIKPYDKEEALSHFEKLGPPVMRQDSLHEMVYGDKPEGQKSKPPRMRCKHI